MTDRFDLEQQILECWKITDEIPMMEAQGATVADMTSLACVYEFKFKQLWATFEAMLSEQQFSRKEREKTDDAFFADWRNTVSAELDKKKKKNKKKSTDLSDATS